MTPVIKKKGSVHLMNFYDALRELFENKRKISRLDWESNEEYGFLTADGKLGIHTKGKDCVWLVSDGDSVATDWFALPSN